MLHARPARLLLAAALLLTAACGPDDDVRVQPLPSLTSLSPEARAGVPSVAGTWRFAGWEVAAGDSAALHEPLPGFGALSLAQKRDSLGGSYLIEGGRAPLAGEIRRDSIISLVTFLAPSDGRFLAGTLARDTFWMEMSSLAEPGRWPAGARAAFVRTPAVAGAAPFLRMHGAPPPPPPVDSARLDSIAAAAAAAAAATPEPAVPQPQPEPTAPTTPAPRPTPPVTRPPAAAPPSQVQPSAPRPQPVIPRPTPRPVPVPEPEVTPPPKGPPLLGVPVPRDSARDSTGVPPR